MRILVTGASGMLGSALAPFLEERGHEVVKHGHSQQSDISCDLTNRGATVDLLAEVSPEVVINLVASTNVDDCERQPHSAYLLNVRTVENLVAGLGKVTGTFLIHISSDQVYDAAGPSVEDDVRLANTYALSKYAGELAALHAQSVVLRTNFFGHSQHTSRKSFSDWLLDNLRQGKPFTAFSDVMFSPVSLPTLCAMIERVVENPVAGIFNLGSRYAMSKADFALELARVYGLSTQAIQIGTSKDVDLIAYRPKDMSMDCRKFETTFGVTMPSLKHEIQTLRAESNATN